MSKRQHKKSYSKRMQDKEKDFLKRAYTGKEFKFSKSAWKTKITGTVVDCKFDTEYSSYLYYIEYMQDDEVCTCYIFRDTDDLEIGSTFNVLQVYDTEEVARKVKAAEKYQKILDKAHSTHRNKENRKSRERRYNYKTYDLEY